MRLNFTPLLKGILSSFLGMTLLFFSPAQGASPRVVVSISPLHGLVAGVMKGVGTPDLLLNPSQSPHTYALRPTDAQSLAQADLIIYVGEGLEDFLEKPLRSLGKKAKILKLLQEEKLELLPTRSAHLWSREEEDTCGCHHGPLDPHLWLSPRNAQIIVDLIEEALSQVDPTHASLYHTNGKKLKQQIAHLTLSLEAQLKPIRSKPYVVFHDGYQYLEHFFDLTGAGALTLHPEMGLAPGTLQKIRRSIEAGTIQCVFSEAQFPPRLMEAVTQGLTVSKGILDPYGMGLPVSGSSDSPQENPYLTLMKNLAQALVAGLGPS
jgi:zinc transport system substrate-binding protein